MKIEPLLFFCATAPEPLLAMAAFASICMVGAVGIALWILAR